MKKLKVQAAILFFLLIFSRAYAYDNHDFQVWNTDGQEFKPNKFFKITTEEEFRWGNNASDFYYQHYDAGLAYLFNKNFNFGGGFRYINEKKSGKFREESEPYFLFLAYWKLAGINFSDRTRIEYRYYDYQVNSWRFRNKLDIKSPWTFTRFKIQPFVADEVFFRFNGIDLNENRLYAGLSFALTKNLSAELSYLWRTTKNTNTCTWNDTNVFSIKTKLAF
ncbi:MAG: DUF2490 domain-containing protein [Candidatus Omnitrophica bacterium]|nr:DUF2490 domain-containing protein [Candidatus Omnitrophota bacterium]